MTLSHRFFCNTLIFFCLATQASGATPVAVDVRNANIDEILAAVEDSSTAFPNATVKKIGSMTLLIVQRGEAELTADAIKELKKSIEAWDQRVQPNPPASGQRVIQLFNIRKAAELVTALTPTGSTGPKLHVFGSDQLIISGGSPAEADRLRRVISLLDQPRPQITMQLWTLQVSDRNANVIERKFDRARALIRLHDSTLRDIYTTTSTGVYNLSKQEDFWTDDLYRYVQSPFLPEIGVNCVDEDYCLGYDIGLEGSPSLSRMLIILALSKTPFENARKVLDPLSNKTELPAFLAEQAKSAKLTSSGYPKLANTLHELERLLTKKSGGLRSFRAAILDYLFQYKWSVSYRNRFSPYNLERSAGRLNAVFSPIIQAFNTDVQIFVEGMQQHPAWPTAPDAEGAGAVLRKMFFNKEPTLEGMVTSGRVRIVSLSGSAAGVSGKTVSFFDMTPPPTFVVPATPPAGNTSGSSGSNAGGSSSGGATEIGSVASQLGLGVLSPLTAGTLTTALRALQQPQPITVEVAKGLTLYVTPQSLAAASEAELNLNLVVGEESAPKVAEGAGNEHLLDRISEARLQTRLVQYKMSLKGGVIPTQDEPGGNLGKVD